MTKNVVSDEERRILAALLAPLADQITNVAVFGSRATGANRPNSDIDLVIYGDLDRDAERRLWTEFEDSNLPVSVDLVVYSRLRHAELKAHIDAVAVPLFAAGELSILHA